MCRVHWHVKALTLLGNMLVTEPDCHRNATTTYIQRDVFDFHLFRKRDRNLVTKRVFMFTCGKVMRDFFLRKNVLALSTVDGVAKQWQFIPVAHSSHICTK